MLDKPHLSISLPTPPLRPLNDATDDELTTPQQLKRTASVRPWMAAEMAELEGELASMHAAVEAARATAGPHRCPLVHFSALNPSRFVNETPSKQLIPQKVRAEK